MPTINLTEHVKKAGRIAAFITAVALAMPLACSDDTTRNCGDPTCFIYANCTEGPSCAPGGCCSDWICSGVGVVCADPAYSDRCFWTCTSSGGTPGWNCCERGTTCRQTASGGSPIIACVP